jgi:hypothetical protein
MAGDVQIFKYVEIFDLSEKFLDNRTLFSLETRPLSAEREYVRSGGILLRFSVLDVGESSASQPVGFNYIQTTSDTAG